MQMTTDETTDDRTVQFTDQEWKDVRECADEHEVEVQNLIHDAVMDALFR